MKLLKMMLAIFAISQLSACAVMSKQECLSANWQTVGFDVGFDGERDITNAFNHRAETCAKHGARANWRAFKTGHAEGITRYCQIDNAIVLGLRGGTHALRDNTCPEREFPDFGRAFADGYKLYELNHLVYTSELELDRLESRIYRARDKRAELKRGIKSGELSEEEVYHADHKRKQLRRDIIALQAEIYACRELLSRHRAHARSYSELLEVEYGRSVY